MRTYRRISRCRMVVAGGAVFSALLIMLFWFVKIPQQDSASHSAAVPGAWLEADLGAAHAEQLGHVAKYDQTFRGGKTQRQAAHIRDTHWWQADFERQHIRHNPYRRPQHPPAKGHESALQKVIAARKGIHCRSAECTNAERRARVVQMMREAWVNYKRFSWGADELSPVSKSFLMDPRHPGVEIWGGISITLIDALDTLWIMGLRKEFDEAVVGSHPCALLLMLAHTALHSWYQLGCRPCLHTPPPK